MKKKLMLLLALALIPAMQTTAFADNDISIIVNGESLQLDQPPIIEDGRTLVPFRAVLEKMGAHVEWDDSTQTVTCTLADKEVSLVIGSNKMQTTDGEITLDVPAKIIGSRTMVPIRAISEGLGATVDWNGEDRVVTVTSNLVEKHDGYSIVSVSSDITYGDSVVMPITVKYPIFDSATRLNEVIKAEAEAIAENYRSAYKSSAESYFKQIDSKKSNWYINVSFDVKYDSAEFVSMYRQDNIYTGGAHDNITVGGLTLDRVDGSRIPSDEIVPDAYSYALEGIESLAQSYAEKYGDEYKNYTPPTEDSFYYDGAIVYVMPPYEIAPFDEGVIQYRVVEQTKNSTINYTTKNLVSDVKDGDKVFKITAKYPALSGDSKEVTAINNAIEADVKATVSACEKEYAEFIKDVDTVPEEWNCEIKYEIKTLNDSIVSMSITNYNYLGGAHPNTTVNGITFNLKTGEKMKAEDFVKDALSLGKDGIRSIVQAEPEQYPFYDEEEFELTDSDFYIEDSELVFVVQPYVIAPYARGLVEYRLNL
jgi:hypothetical protein